MKHSAGVTSLLRKRWMWVIALMLLLPLQLPAQSLFARLFKTGRYARPHCASMGAYNKHKKNRLKKESQHRSTKSLAPGTVTQVSTRKSYLPPTSARPTPKPLPKPSEVTAPKTNPPVVKANDPPGAAPPGRPITAAPDSIKPLRKIAFRDLPEDQRRRSLEQRPPDVILPPIRFITAQDEFSVVNMDSFMQAMEYAQQGKIVLIEGHTDDVGSDDSNLKLSMKRAEKIRQLMLSGGVNDDLISVIGFGESRPLVPNISAENRAVNRRIEFKIFSVPQ